jgi:hypothetical protein
MFGRRDVDWRFRVDGASGELWRLGSLSRPRGACQVFRV